MDEEKVSENDIMKELRKDIDLREIFIKNPKQVLNERYNWNLPEDYTVNVYEETVDTIHIVLPQLDEE